MKRLVLAAALASVAMTGVACAQTPATPAPPTPGAARHMGPADLNRDGVVTREEVTADADAKFARMDANRDGRITTDERQKMRRDRMEARGKTPPAPRPGMANTVVTREEFRAKALQRFDGADADRNGRIEGAETARMRGHHRGGRGGPGRGGRGGPGGMGMLMMADTNRDGAVTQAELTASTQAMFQRLDTNRDGRVTRDEMTAARPDRGPGRGPDAMQRPVAPNDAR